jgi:hypothetical protein
MKGPAQPAQPNPKETAAAQTTSNVNTAVANTALNNANEVNPYGSVNYAISGYQDIDGQKVPTYTKTTTLDPSQQRLLDQQNQLGEQMNGIAGRQLGTLDTTLSKPIDFSGAPAAPTADRAKYEEALFNRINPELHRSRSALEAQLANQGIMPGSEAYREAIALSDRGINDARSQAVIGAGDYAGQELSQGQSARNNYIQEQLTARNQPINEISTLMNGGQVTMPQFQQYQGGNIAGTDVAGITQAAYQNQMAAYNQKLASRNAMMGGIAGLAGKAATIPFMGGIGG